MSSLKQSAVGRVKAGGISTASLLDLVCVGFSRREDDVEGNEPHARDLVLKLGKVGAFADIAATDLAGFGLEGFENLRSLALLEIGRRAGSAGVGDKTHITEAKDIVSLLKRQYKGQKKEYFVAVLLDAKNAVMRVAEIHVGTLKMSPVGGREVFREAIRDGASAVIVAHNHPSGDPTPSPDDLNVTVKLKAIGELLDIPLLDHLVIGDRYAVSAMNGARIG